MNIPSSPNRIRGKPQTKTIGKRKNRIDYRPGDQIITDYRNIPWFGVILRITRTRMQIRTGERTFWRKKEQVKHCNILEVS